jgi:putative membrane protein
MDKPLRSAAAIAAAAVLLAACSSTGDKPYAHESMPHQTAAEQLFGTTGGPVMPAPTPPVATVTEPVVVAPAAPAVVTPTPPLTVPQPVARMVPSDADFAQQALSSSAFEIELARIAFVRAQSQDVRSFARQMLIDHREMAINLDNFGLVRGYLVDWQLDPEQANAIDRLRSLDSASFDRAYMDEMVTSHEQALARFETQAGSGRETAALAKDAVPIVRHHLEMARDLQARL